MRKKAMPRLVSSLSLILAAGLLPHAARANSVQYTVTELAPTSGASDAVALNNVGQVAGAAGTPNEIAFLYSESNGLTSLGHLPGDDNSQAWGINDSGTVVGASFNVSTFTQHAFVYTTADGLQPLPGVPTSESSTANAINNAGTIVGGFTAGGSPDYEHAFTYTTAGGLVDIGLLASNFFSVANAVNNADQATGEAVFGSSTAQPTAFFYDLNNGMTNLGTLPNGTNSTGAAINDAGQVVGSGDVTGGFVHAFLYTPGGGMADLGTLAGADNSEAFGMNNSGQVTGTSFNDQQELTAFLYTPGQGMIDLNTLIDPALHLHLAAAYAINSAGTIAGFAQDASGNYQAVLLTPASAVPTPMAATSGLALLGLLALTKRRRPLTH